MLVEEMVRELLSGRYVRRPSAARASAERMSHEEHKMLKTVVAARRYVARTKYEIASLEKLAARGLVAKAGSGWMPLPGARERSRLAA